MEAKDIDVTVDQAKAASEENIEAIIALARLVKPGVDDKQLDFVRSIAKSSFMMGAGWMRRELHERTAAFLEEKLEGALVGEINKGAEAN